MPRHRVVVYESNINRLFDAGNDVQAFARKLSRETLEVAGHTYFTEGIGIRTGNLYRSMRIEVRRTRIRGVTGSVIAAAAYARYVHEGTGPIYGDMWVRPAPHSYYRTRVHRWFVNGQAPKPWLEVAGEIVAQRHGAF